MGKAEKGDGKDRVPRRHVVYLEDQEGKRMYIRPGVITLGRGKGNHLVVSDREASRQHLQFRLSYDQGGRGTLRLRNCSAHSKTFLNDVRIEHVQALRLRLGDVLTIGSTRFLVMWTRRLPAVSGDLYKQSPSFHRKWQRRHVVVKHGALTYYKVPYVEGAMPAGNIPLCSVVRIVDGEQKMNKEQVERSNTFFVEVNGRTFAFRAKNAGDRKKWTIYLRERVEEAHGFPPVELLNKSSVKSPSTVAVDRPSAAALAPTMRPIKSASTPLKANAVQGEKKDAVRQTQKNETAGVEEKKSKEKIESKKVEKGIKEEPSNEVSEDEDEDEYESKKDEEDVEDEEDEEEEEEDEDEEDEEEEEEEDEEDDDDESEEGGSDHEKEDEDEDEDEDNEESTDDD